MLFLKLLKHNCFYFLQNNSGNQFNRTLKKNSHVHHHHFSINNNEEWRQTTCFQKQKQQYKVTYIIHSWSALFYFAYSKHNCSFFVVFFFQSFDSYLSWHSTTEQEGKSIHNCLFIFLHYLDNKIYIRCIRNLIKKQTFFLRILLILLLIKIIFC